MSRHAMPTLCSLETSTDLCTSPPSLFHSRSWRFRPLSVQHSWHLSKCKLLLAHRWKAPPPAVPPPARTALGN